MKFQSRIKSNVRYIISDYKIIYQEFLFDRLCLFILFCIIMNYVLFTARQRRQENESRRKEAILASLGTTGTESLFKRKLRALRRATLRLFWANFLANKCCTETKTIKKFNEYTNRVQKEAERKKCEIEEEHKKSEYNKIGDINQEQKNKNEFIVSPTTKIKSLELGSEQLYQGRCNTIIFNHEFFGGIPNLRKRNSSKNGYTTSTRICLFPICENTCFRDKGTWTMPFYYSQFDYEKYRILQKMRRLYRDRKSTIKSGSSARLRVFQGRRERWDVRLKSSQRRVQPCIFPVHPIRNRVHSRSYAKTCTCCPSIAPLAERIKQETEWSDRSKGDYLPCGYTRQHREKLVLPLLRTSPPRQLSDYHPRKKTRHGLHIKRN